MEALAGHLSRTASHSSKHGLKEKKKGALGKDRGGRLLGSPVFNLLGKG